jgi:hypothetical protein
VLLRPFEELAAQIDDTATVAAEPGAGALPAKVVERAPLDAQERGGFFDDEKRVVGIVGHGVSSTGG